MNCNNCCKLNACVPPILEQYIKSQVRRKARKAYKVTELEAKARDTEWKYRIECNHAKDECTSLLKKEFPHLIRYIKIDYGVKYDTPEWKAYWKAKDECENDIKDEINRIMAAAQSGKTYDEVVEMVKSLTFKVKED